MTMLRFCFGLAEHLRDEWRVWLLSVAFLISVWIALEFLHVQRAKVMTDCVATQPGDMTYAEKLSFCGDFVRNGGSHE